MEVSVNSPPEFSHPTLHSSTTEIYIPSFLVTGSKVVVDGLAPSDKFKYDESVQTLFIVSGDQTPGRRIEIIVSLSPALKPIFDVNDYWSDWGTHIAAAGTAVLAVFAYILMLFIF